MKGKIKTKENDMNNTNNSKINNILKLIKEKKWIHYLIICIIGILVSLPFLWVQISISDDGKYHLLRLIGLDNAFKYGSFPYLVFPFFCKDFGYSMTVFYPQLVTYIPYVISLIVGTFAGGLKVFASLTTIISGIFMYNFVNEVTKKKGISFLAAILYMIIPYRFENLFNRFAIGEFTSFIFIPIVFQGLYNLLHGDKKRHYYIAIGATGLLITHSISTIYTAFFCLLYILFNIKLFFKKEVIKKCIINVVFILLMSAMFILPMLEFRSMADYSILEPSVMKTDSISVSEKTISPWQFIKDRNEENGVSFILGIHFIVMVLIGVFAYKKIDKKLKDFYIISIILGIIGLIMCTNLFPWQIMPDFMCTLQYPWRLLGFAYFFFVPVCAINIYYLVSQIKKEGVRNAIYISILIVLAVFTLLEFRRYKDNNTQDLELDEENYVEEFLALDDEYEENIKENPEIHYFSINRDNLPLKGLIKQRDYLLDRTDNVYVLSGEIQILNENKFALSLEFEIKNAKKQTTLELPYFYYPGYTVNLMYDNKKEVLDTYESENGMLQITIPEDIQEGKITVQYTATTFEKVAYLISGISVIGFICYVIYFRKKNKENI